MCDLTKRYHPYFFLPLYPALDFLLFITKNLFFSLGLIYAILASFAVMFVYKSIRLITNQKFLPVILASIYGVTWIQIYMSQTFIWYLITGFYFSVLIYLVLKELKTKEYNISNLILIILVCALAFGVTIANFYIMLFLILPIFLIKRNPKIILSSLVLFIILVFSFTYLKGATCHNSNFKHLYATKAGMQRWVRYDIKSNWKSFKLETLTYPIIKGNNEKLLSRTFIAGFVALFVLSLFLLKKSKLRREDFILYAFLVVDLFYNLISTFFWSPADGLIFSLNHLALWFMVMAYAIDIIQTSFDKKLLNITLNSIFVLYFLVLLNYNHINNVEFHKDAIKRAPVTYNFLKVNNND